MAELNSVKAGNLSTGWVKQNIVTGNLKGVSSKETLFLYTATAW